VLAVDRLEIEVVGVDLVGVGDRRLDLIAEVRMVREKGHDLVAMPRLLDADLGDPRRVALERHHDLDREVRLGRRGKCHGLRCTGVTVEGRYVTGHTRSTPPDRAIFPAPRRSHLPPHPGVPSGFLVSCRPWPAPS
jgi:hypothetical protein